MRWASTVRPLHFQTLSARQTIRLFLLRTFLAAREASSDCHKQKCSTSRVQSQDYSAKGGRDDPDEDATTYEYYSCIVCDRTPVG